MKKYEQLAHTADILVRMYGRSLNELFENALMALVETMVEGALPEANKKQEIDLSGGDILELLVNWLNEILYFFQVENKLITTADVEIISENRMKAVSSLAEKADKKVRTASEIKAATYHDLNLKKEKGLYMTDIIFDI